MRHVTEKNSMKKIKITYLVNGSWGHDEYYTSEDGKEIMTYGKKVILENFREYYDYPAEDCLLEEIG